MACEWVEHVWGRRVGNFVTATEEEEWPRMGHDSAVVSQMMQSSELKGFWLLLCEEESIWGTRFTF